MAIPNIVRPDLKAVVWLLAGYLVLGRVVGAVRGKLGV